jgi:UDP-N-acetylmuramoylalanine--D-glutamate ligase
MKLAGKHVTVMGLGRFGGGVGVARYLAGQGAHVTVTDLDTADNLTASIAAAGDVIYHLGGHRAEDFTHTDLVIVNPAVKPGNEYLELARAAGVPVGTEINLFFERCPARIIGVTGSVGKTTVTSMIARALDGPNTWLGGNIGRSLLDELPRISVGDTVVLELSSAQLHRLEPTGLAPHIAVVTNISPNHLDWHPSMEHYVASKHSMATSQSASDIAVLNADDDELARWTADAPSRVILFSTRRELDEGVFVRDGELIARRNGHETTVLQTDAMTVPGAHNVANAAAAAAACLAADADPGTVGDALIRFEGAEHRIELVREVGGVRYFNDSKATTPASSVAAIEAFDAPVVLILGGRDKGVSYEPVAAAAAKCKAAILVGEMAGPLDALLAECAPHVPRTRVERFDDTVTMAARLAEPGDVVLLSPACTSYDMFKNYEQRGRAFKDAVARLG